MKTLHRAHVIVLAILLTGCASAISVLNSNAVRTGMTKTQVKSGFLSVSVSEDPFSSRGVREWDRDTSTEILSGSANNIFLVFSNVSLPYSC